MARSFDNTLVIAISSRALFDLEQSHAVYVDKGIDAYCQYQIDHENEALAPGVAFPMVQKFLSLNKGTSQHIEIVLISRNSADTGLRVFNSIEHYGLDISRAAFTGGQSPYQYVKPFGADLFLSADPLDVRQALDSGAAAATILPSHVGQTQSSQLKIAFDGDAVLFSDEAEKIYQQQGLKAFSEKEKQSANQPLPGGPFKNILAALHRIQSTYLFEDSPIRTALITARGAPAHERVIKTLRAWDVRIDESYFLGGMDKGKFLQTFGADIFFDDQQIHCESARKHVPTGHVPAGVANTRKASA
ncbi:MAG: 5'-nucleotidase [Gammaproteobacteria bacterium]|nr:5'-nucleotidase [Gammaproteobacteria bacterium]NKB63634.1 5'-nucleotidase [Gammaproteobacteria bacterium]NKB65308.1 5'-nucleotidase [Gammaproteobacteria bacterium]